MLVVNTRSMVPSILPKDVMLVEKVSPVLKRIFHLPVAQSGDVIFFTAPQRMHDYISTNRLQKIQPGSLIVKRVQSVEQGENGECFDVRGDFPSVSVDSRDWGLLSEKNVIGRPILRVFPPARVGLVK
jgi:signal peptidase I